MSFSTLDNLATWMLTNIRLSRYDNQFVNNLTMYIIQHNRITSNQDLLFKKVAKKYHRQFLHYKINVDDSLKLKWTVNIVESTPEHTGATIKIENNKIIFKSPYNKNFLTALRRKSPYNLQWIKEKKQYETDYSPTTLKQLMYLSADHYSVINYCDTVKKIVDNLSRYESIKYWTPTLIYNGIYYIAAINEYVYDAIKDIEISDDLGSMAQIVKYGVHIDQSVIDHLNKTHDPNKVRFATSFHLSADKNDIKTIVGWLYELGCDAIAETRLFIPKYTIDISHTDIYICKNYKELKDYKNPVAIYYRGHSHVLEHKPIKLFKIIKFVNSDPVNLGPK